MTTPQRQVSTSVPELVVRRLAFIAVTALALGAGLLALAIFQPGKVDATTVAIIGNFITLAGTAAGGLSAILASTRTGEPGEPPQPVKVVNEEKDAVPVEPTPPDPGPDPLPDVPPGVVPTHRPHKKTPARKKTSVRRRRAGEGGTLTMGLAVALAVTAVLVFVVALVVSLAD